jgi:threonylcarbamoyladenosine tRNA methylthiotransferase MtaB
LPKVFEVPASDSAPTSCRLPGKTEESFERPIGSSRLPLRLFPRLQLLETVGTRAARLSEHVPTEAIKERSERLRDLSASRRRAFGERFVGREVEVLFEQKDESGLWTGLTGNYLRVGVASSESLRNQLRRVTVSEAGSDLALGVLAGRE